MQSAADFLQMEIFEARLGRHLKSALNGPIMDLNT